MVEDWRIYYCYRTVIFYPRLGGLCYFNFCFIFMPSPFWPQPVLKEATTVTFQATPWTFLNHPLTTNTKLSVSTIRLNCIWFHWFWISALWVFVVSQGANVPITHERYHCNLSLLPVNQSILFTRDVSDKFPIADKATVAINDVEKAFQTHLLLVHIMCC